MRVVNRYAVWNNKGGVGKSFLAFALATEYARQNSREHVLVVDMCPQANCSEMLLGGSEEGAKELRKLQKVKRKTVAGYIESRLSTSPYSSSGTGGEYAVNVHAINHLVPENVYLVPGDHLIEIQAQAIYQMAQLTIPENAWAAVHLWVRNLCDDIAASLKRPVSVFIDCNPSFAIYTELAMIAADDLIVPFTADDSSRRAIENIGALLYGITTSKLYRSISFSERAKHFRMQLPLLHTFVSNRVTTYRSKPSSAFSGMRSAIQQTVEAFQKDHPQIFDPEVTSVAESFFDVPDYHSACIVATNTGSPVATVKAGLHIVHDKRVQLNQPNLNRYALALTKLVERLK